MDTQKILDKLNLKIEDTTEQNTVFLQGACDFDDLILKRIYGFDDRQDAINKREDIIPRVDDENLQRNAGYLRWLQDAQRILVEEMEEEAGRKREIEDILRDIMKGEDAGLADLPHHSAIRNRYINSDMQVERDQHGDPILRIENDGREEITPELLMELKLAEQIGFIVKY